MVMQKVLTFTCAHAKLSTFSTVSFLLSLEQVQTRLADVISLGISRIMMSNANNQMHFVSLSIMFHIQFTSHYLHTNKGSDYLKYKS